MSWLQKLLPPKIKRGDTSARNKSIPEGLWSKCDGCESVLYRSDLEGNLSVCPKCGHHHRVGARRRLDLMLDAEGRVEIGAEVTPVDALKFKDSRKYPDRLSAAAADTGEADAMVVMRGAIKSLPVVVACFEFDFLGGSMGSVVGEKFTLAAERALEIGAPFVNISASGGARMQERLFSLMQMAKTSAALGRLRAAGLPYISVLSHPTTGGVSASFAMLGDLNIAEPEALIGFAGPRVIEQTVREKLPEGFQRSEFLLEHGAIDQICDRRDLRDHLADVLGILTGQPRLEEDQTVQAA